MIDKAKKLLAHHNKRQQARLEKLIETKSRNIMNVKARAEKLEIQLQAMVQKLEGFKNEEKKIEPV